MAIEHFTKVEHHTTIAALRFFAFMGQCNPDTVVGWVQKQAEELKLQSTLTTDECHALAQRMRDNPEFEPHEQQHFEPIRKVVPK